MMMDGKKDFCRCDVCATMDAYYAGLDPRFKQATSVLATIISRRPDRIVTDTGKKTVGRSQAVPKDYDYPIYHGPPPI